MKLKVAEASVSFLRTATNANAVMVDGISDSDENRRLWKEYAFEAYDLLKEVHKARPDDPHVHVLMAEVRSDFLDQSPSAFSLPASLHTRGVEVTVTIDEAAQPADPQTDLISAQHTHPGLHLPDELQGHC